MASSKKTAKRDLLILVRYTIKKDYAPKGLHAGDVVLLVRNDQGREYYVTLRRNKAHSCTCSAGQHSRKCYHVSTLVELENTRYAAHKAAKVAQSVVSKPVQPVVSPVADEERYAMSETLLAKLAPKTNVVDIAERGSLNGAQQSAGFWEMLPSRKAS